MPTQLVSNNPLVNQHHAALRGLMASLVRGLRSPQLARIDKSSAQYAAVFTALVQEFSAASASLNADYYDNARADAGITTPYRAPAIDVPPAEQVKSLLSTATADPMAAQSFVESTAGLLVTSTGKNLLIAAIMGDGKAKKWARVTRAGACAFCRMLATRGAVYRSETTASFVAHPKAGGKGGVCQCTIEAVFHPESYEPTAATRADQKLYADATEHVYPGEQLNAFRRALAAQDRGEVPVFATARPRPTGPTQSEQVVGLLDQIAAAMRSAP